MNNLYADSFYAKREDLVREHIGDRLDILRKDLSQLDSPCTAKLFALPQDKVLTIDDLLSCEPTLRKQFLSTLLYHDAYWRMEAAYLTLCVGMLSIAYSNLRSCLETLVAAHIIENLDDEAQNFLTKGSVDPTKISRFIPEEYNKNILKMKESLSEWGVHSRLLSTQLSNAFGPSAFDKMISHTSAKRDQTINPHFVDAANTCIEMIGNVFLMFMFLMHKGTKYKA